MADFNAATVKVHQLLMKLSQEPLIERESVIKELVSQGAGPQEIDVFIKSRKESRKALWITISIIAQTMNEIEEGRDSIEAVEHAASMQRLAFSGDQSDVEMKRLMQSLMPVFR